MEVVVGISGKVDNGSVAVFDDDNGCIGIDWGCIAGVIAWLILEVIGADVDVRGGVIANVAGCGISVILVAVAVVLVVGVSGVDGGSRNGGVVCIVVGGVGNGCSG